MTGDDGSAPGREDGEGPDPRSGPLAAVNWFLETDHETASFVRELLSSVLAVAFIGLLLFGVSGVWPPMVAVESGSMTPHMNKGDLVFLMEEHRFPPGTAYGDTGVVTYRGGEAADYRKFGDYGDVIVFGAPSRARPSIIHRARFWVEEGENWYEEANEEYISDHVTSCDELSNCPAPHAGFITKGDANDYYDQARGISAPVKPEWIRGTAELRVPWLGWVRLLFSGVSVDATVAPVVHPTPATTSETPHLTPEPPRTGGVSGADGLQARPGLRAVP